MTVSLIQGAQWRPWKLLKVMGDTARPEQWTRLPPSSWSSCSMFRHVCLWCQVSQIKEKIPGSPLRRVYHPAGRRTWEQVIALRVIKQWCQTQVNTTHRGNLFYLEFHEEHFIIRKISETILLSLLKIIISLLLKNKYTWIGLLGSDFFYSSECIIHPTERVTSSVTSRPRSKTCPTTPMNIKSTKVLGLECKSTINYPQC